MPMPGYQPGTLWQRMQDVTLAARKSGSQQPMPTAYSVVEDQGIPFVVRTLSVLEDKARDREERQREEEVSGRKFNPFLPYEEDLFVADVSETHLCLLNKFNVIDNHLLIVTRQFENQETLLNLQDFEALWSCMCEFDGLGFYNGGEVAGASQEHKHLQLVPLPMVPKGPRVPLDPVLAHVLSRGGVSTSPRLPYAHALVRFSPDGMGPPAEAAPRLLEGYQALLDATGLGAGQGAEEGRQQGPYNLLVTREWMCLVPRSREHFHSISVNALGFAGGLLVRNREEMDMVRRTGPMDVLRTVGVAPLL